MQNRPKDRFCKQTYCKAWKVSNKLVFNSHTHQFGRITDL